MPDFYFLGGEIVHYPLSNGVDEVSEQFFFAQTGFSTVWVKTQSVLALDMLLVPHDREKKIGEKLGPAANC